MKREWYDQVIKEFEDRVGFSVSPEQQPAVRSAIHKMFLDDFTINEITGKFEPAFDKKKWPQGTGFWKRVHQLLLEERRHAWVSKEDGTKSLKDILTTGPFAYFKRPGESKDSRN